MENSVGLQFLIDYENVREAGLAGIEHLYQTDTLNIFYSAACQSVSRKMMDYILQSGCEFRIYCLKKTGKNALDFYLVSRVGELLGAGYRGKIVVVSKDKGYSAMRDYWIGQGIASDRILLRHTVKDGIVASNENSVRRKRILTESASVSIEREHAKYEERERIKSRMKKLFQGTEYEASLERICALAEEKKRPKDLYLSSLKRFGRSDGMKIYRYLKQRSSGEECVEKV